MKKCSCRLFGKIFKLLFKLLGLVFGIFAVLFTIFFFDLDGKFLYYVVEPFLKKHYDNMERKDVLRESGYDVEKYPKYEYTV